MPDIALRGDGWSHDVLIGPVGQAEEAFLDHLRDRRFALVTDDHVWALHGKALAFLGEIEPIFVERGEAAKNWQTAIALIRHFDRLELHRHSPVIAFGGGAVGDVTGFAASLFKRGCPVIHVPTTLLSQVDSAVGGKTAIDDLGQKNLVGTFHPPGLVICDPAFLETLDVRQRRSGYAEVVKYGAIGDADFFAWCEVNGADFLAHPNRHGDKVIATCVSAKADYVAGDFKDLSGRRALLNFGHSFGHALESLAGPDRLLHGEAVAIGMCLAFRLSSDLALCAGADANRFAAHLSRCGLPTRIADAGLTGSADSLMALMTKDKKNADGRPVLILSHGIGKAIVHPVDAAQLRAFLDRAD